MKKLLALIIIIIIAVLAYIAISADSLIKNAANKELPKLLGVPARVDAVHVEFTKGTVAIEGMYVGAPDGMHIPYTFKVSRVYLEMPLSSLMHIHKYARIKLIEINSPSLYYSITAKGNNIKHILAHVQSQSKDSEAQDSPAKPAAAPKSAAAKPDAGAAKSSKSEAYKVIIDRLVISNTNANLVAFGSKPASATIPKIELKNIGSVANRATVNSAVQQVLRALLHNVSKQDIQGILNKAGVNKLKNQAQDQVKSLGGQGIKGLKKLFGH